VTDDPFADRRTGLRRVHVVTASVATAAVVGTGATAFALASAHQAAAQQPAPVPVQHGSDDDGGAVAPAAPQDGVQQPVAPPGRSFGDGSGDASSGGS
jgi:hypothetical protein